MNRYVILLFCPVFLLADKVFLTHFHHDISPPWSTGPLLAPSGYVVPAGHANYEPYLYVTAYTGDYDGDWHVVEADHTLWNNVFQPILQFGLTSWLDFQFSPTLFYNYTDHQAQWLLADLPVGIDIQLYKPDTALSWIPAFKLALRETFPVGKYRNRKASKQEADVSGTGSFETSIGLVIGKLFHFGGVSFLNFRLLLECTLPAPVRLRGYNTYGGGKGTDARLFPPQNFQFDIGMEFILTRNWVFACDLVGNYWKKTHFSGNPGLTPEGTPAALGIPNFAVQYAIAPAIEYNWSGNLGIIGGGWFSVAGRNSPNFWSAVFAVNYYQ